MLEISWIYGQSENGQGIGKECNRNVRYPFSIIRRNLVVKNRDIVKEEASPEILAEYIRGKENKVQSIRDGHLDRSRRLNLKGRNLEYADFSRSRFYGTEFDDHTSFRCAILERADFSLQEMAGIHMEGATLSGAQRRFTTLADAHLEFADLAGANLQGADMHNAHLTGAYLGFGGLSSGILNGANGHVATGGTPDDER